ncbi:hypothetical protein PIB30_096030 [Stylosanthes scabra]|uniref:Uncharacterized protein n=1 Tax=Stylosanthes scabra TaxID=79078 RepID=A0ABU6WVT3_9FABA|nr:hypothetical protein [Stylosanthes scabra]
MQTNAEKGRPMFFGCLKSDYVASSSSQADPQEPVPLQTAPPIPGYQPPHPPPNYFYGRLVLFLISYFFRKIDKGSLRSKKRSFGAFLAKASRLGVQTRT